MMGFFRNSLTDLTQYRWFSTNEVREPERKETVETHTLCEEDSWLRALGYIGLCPELFPLASLPQATITIEKRVLPMQTLPPGDSSPIHPDGIKVNVPSTRHPRKKEASKLQLEKAFTEMVVTKTKTIPETVWKTVWETSYRTAYDNAFEMESIEYNTDGTPTRKIFFNTDGWPTKTMLPGPTTSTEWYRTDDSWFEPHVQIPALMAFFFIIIFQNLLWRWRRRVNSRNCVGTQSRLQSRTGEVAKSKIDPQTSSGVDTPIITRSMSNTGSVGRKPSSNSSAAGNLSPYSTGLRHARSTPTQRYIRHLTENAGWTEAEVSENLSQNGLETSQEIKDSSMTELSTEPAKADFIEVDVAQEEAFHPTEGNISETSGGLPRDVCENSAENLPNSLADRPDEVLSGIASLAEEDEAQDEEPQIIRAHEPEAEATEDLSQDVHESSAEDRDNTPVQSPEENATVDLPVSEEQVVQDKESQIIEAKEPEVAGYLPQDIDESAPEDDHNAMIQSSTETAAAAAPVHGEQVVQNESSQTTTQSLLALQQDNAIRDSDDTPHKYFKLQFPDNSYDLIWANGQPSIIHAVVLSLIYNYPDFAEFVSVESILDGIEDNMTREALLLPPNTKFCREFTPERLAEALANCIAMLPEAIRFRIGYLTPDGIPHLTSEFSDNSSSTLDSAKIIWIYCHDVVASAAAKWSAVVKKALPIIRAHDRSETDLLSQAPPKSPTSSQETQCEGFTEGNKQDRISEQTPERKDFQFTSKPVSIDIAPTPIKATVPDLKIFKEPTEIKKNPGMVKEVHKETTEPHQEQPPTTERVFAKMRQPRVLKSPTEAKKMFEFSTTIPESLSLKAKTGTKPETKPEARPEAKTPEKVESISTRDPWAPIIGPVSAESQFAAGFVRAYKRSSQNLRPKSVDNGKTTSDDTQSLADDKPTKVTKRLDRDEQADGAKTSVIGETLDDATKTSVQDQVVEQLISNLQEGLLGESEHEDAGVQLEHEQQQQQRPRVEQRWEEAEHVGTPASEEKKEGEEDDDAQEQTSEVRPAAPRTPEPQQGANNAEDEETSEMYAATPRTPAEPRQVANDAEDQETSEMPATGPKTPEPQQVAHDAEDKEKSETYVASPKTPETRQVANDAVDEGEMAHVVDEEEAAAAAAAVKSSPNSNASSKPDSLFDGDIIQGEYVGTPP